MVVDKNLFRPTEIMIGWGNASKAASKLGWSPRFKMEDVARIIVIPVASNLASEPHESSISNSSRFAAY